MRLIVGAATDVGRVRDGNEDAYLVDDAIGLVAVADGMGGHRAGEVASATALEALRAAVTNGRPLRDAVVDANDAVHAKSLTADSLRGMGTTLTAGTLAAGGTLIVAHVGDSRAYLYSDGELRQLTLDHSLVEELVRDGRLTADEAAVHPQRSIITRALGVDSTVEVDVHTVTLAPGDRVLLCSDGLTGMLHPDDIGAVLRREPEPARAATALVDAANAAGGEDNITVVVVSVTDEPDDRPADGDGDVLVVDTIARDDARDPPVDEPRATRRTWWGRRRAAEDTDKGTGKDTSTARRATRGAVHGAGRVLLWTLPILLVLGIAIGAMGWYARRGYFVGFDQGKVTIFKGVPDGIAWWHPTVATRTSLGPSDLTDADLAAIHDRQQFSSRTDANAFVNRVRDHAEAAASAATQPAGAVVASPTRLLP